jgi:hypothetical protein
MAQQIQLRNDSTTGWDSANPVLAQGEIGINTTTKEFKIGDGESTWTELEYFTNGGGMTLPASIKDTGGNDLIVFEKSGTGAARIHAVQDDLALRSANDILLYPGDDGPGKVYIGWGDARYTPDASNEVATKGYVDNATGASAVKYRVWGYPTEGAIAIMPTTDNESIALKSSDAAAIRWHVRNNGGSGDSIIPTAAVVTPGDGNYQVVFTIPEQNSVPPTGSYYYQINCPNNNLFDTALYAQAATTTSITFYYPSDPGVFDASGASIYPPSVYSQFEVDSDGAHIKIADWSSGPGSYSQTWDFTKEGAIHFPYGPSNNRTGSGDVLRFAQSFDQSIITGTAPTYENPTANRLVVAGQDGTAGDGYDGEGGDIYLWAGQGGGTNGDGGDIKVDAGNGQGTGEGGYVKVRGGYSPNGEGGFVNIDAGSSSTGSGGSIQITAGNSFNGENTYGGAVQIYSGQSNTNGYGGNIYLTTQSGGKIFLQPAADHVYVGSESPGNRVAQVEDLAYTRVAVPASSIGVEGHRLDMIADDANYHYYCTGTYDGTTNIWKRVAWSVDTWGV